MSTFITKINVRNTNMFISLTLYFCRYNKLIMNSELLYNEFGAQLKKARRSAKLTQERLADQVGLSRTSITNIEKGRQHVTLHVLFLLAGALRIKPKDLLPEMDYVQKICESTNRLLEEADLANDVKSWAGKGLASLEKKEKNCE